MASGYPPAGTAGLERGCQRLARALVRRGFGATVLTLAVPDLPRRQQDEAGVTVLRVLRPWPVGPLWGASYMWQCARWLRRLRDHWDVVFCQQLYLHSAVAVPMARRFGKLSANLLVASDSYSDIDRLRRLRGGDRLTARALDADAQFALSRRSAGELLRAGVPSDRVFGYRYFVDTDAFAPRGTASDAEFVFLGRFDPQKNLPLLIDAFERVFGVAPRARLRLVGRGPENDAIRRRAAASLAADAIAFEDWTSEPAAKYRHALAVVTASDAEGLSNVLIEAMACGAPVITTDVSGARDALDDDGTWPEPLPPGTVQAGTGGWLVNRGDADALATAMLDLLEHPTSRRVVGQRARQRACAHYTEDACVTEFLHHIDTVRARAGRERVRP